MGKARLLTQRRVHLHMLDTAALTLVLDVQWLVFRKDGATTAGQWAQETAQSVSQSGFLAVFDRGKAQRQQAFVKEVLRQTMKVRPVPCTTPAPHSTAGMTMQSPR